MRNAFFNRYGFRVLLIVVFLLPFVWMGTRRTLMSNSNNVADWLPSTFEETKQYKWFLEHFPFERFVVVTWKGCNLDDPRLEMMAEKLVPGQTIDNMHEWADGQALTAELVDGDTDNVRKTVDSGKTPSGANTDTRTGSPPLNSAGKTDNPDASQAASQKAGPSTSGVLPPENTIQTAKTENGISRETLPAKELPRYFKSVLTGPRLVRMLKDRYSDSDSGAISMSDEEIFEKLRGTLIGPDGYSTALIATLTTEAPQGKELANVLEAVREAGRECGIHPEKKVDDRPWPTRAASFVVKTIHEMFVGRTPQMDGVIIGGPPVDNVAITYEGEYTLYRLAGLCAVIGLFLAWLCFRDVRLTMFVFWISILCAGIALACVSLTGSSCDAILLSMPALVYVLAMSGSVHLINYYHDAIREHGLDLAPERAVGHAKSPCFFANFTTALGLISLYTSHLVPITKFGIYAALGVMLQLLIIFYYLPTLLHFYPSKKIAAERSLNIAEDSFMQKFWRVWGTFIIRHNRAVVLCCFFAMVFFGYGMTKIQTSVKMMRFFSADSEIIAHYTYLEGQIGPLVPMEVVVKFDNQRCDFNTLQRLHLIEDIDAALKKELKNDVGGIMSAETAVPRIPRSDPHRRKSGRQISIESAANFMIDKNRRLLKDYITVEGNRSLHSDDSYFRQTLEELGLDAADAARLVRAGVEDLDGLRNLPEGERLFGIAPAQLQEFRDKLDRWDRKHGTDLWRVSLRVWSLREDIDYAVFIDDVKAVVDKEIADAERRLFDDPEDAAGAITAVYTGMVPLVYKTQHELLAGLRDSFITSFLMIGVTMAFILRSPLAGFCAMIPNVFPVVIVFGFMGQAGFLVDVGTVMTASVALGIAVDDTIHFLTWFRDGIDQGMSQKQATMFAYSRCATSMFQTTLIAGLGLAAFALSTFTPTQMFGIMMLAILSAALFGDIIFLAALLNTPIGRVFRPRKKKQPPATEALPENVDKTGLPEQQSEQTGLVETPAEPEPLKPNAWNPRKTAGKYS